MSEDENSWPSGGRLQEELKWISYQGLWGFVLEERGEMIYQWIWQERKIALGEQANFSSQDTKFGIILWISGSNWSFLGKDSTLYNLQISED